MIYRFLAAWPKLGTWTMTCRCSLLPCWSFTHYGKCQRYMLNVHMRKSYNANEYIRKSWKANKHQICPSPSTLQLSRRVLNCLQPPRAEKPPPPEFFSRSAACNSADSKCCNESFHPRLILHPAYSTPGPSSTPFPLPQPPFPSHWTTINCSKSTNSNIASRTSQ